MKVIPWTAEEEALLLNNISKYATKSEAYVETSKVLGRSEDACAVRWKKKLSKNVEQQQEFVVEEMTIVTPPPVEKFDVIKEMTRIMDEHNVQVKQIKDMESHIKQTNGAMFDLNFENTQLKNKNEELQYQVENFASLVEAAASEHSKYIEENRNLNLKLEAQITKSEKLLSNNKELEDMVKVYKSDIAKLKAELEENQTENSAIYKIFNKARQMFTGVDNTEPTKLRMERNGNLERVR